MISSISGFAMILVAILVTPTALATVASPIEDPQREATDGRILSAGSAAVFLLIYGSYLFFRLKTHRGLFDDDGDDETYKDVDNERRGAIDPLSAGVLFLTTALLLSLCVESLLDAIPEVVEGSSISRTSIGFILFPFLEGAGGSISTVIIAYRNKQDFALGFIVRRVIQTILFVVPLLVITGRVLGNELTLYFGHVEAVAVLITSMMVVLLLQNGRSTYFDGLLLIGMYTMVVMAVAVLPHD